jgi:hypothetical protein
MQRVLIQQSVMWRHHIVVIVCHHGGGQSVLGCFPVEMVSSNELG